MKIAKIGFQLPSGLHRFLLTGVPVEIGPRGVFWEHGFDTVRRKGAHSLPRRSSLQVTDDSSVL